MVDAGDNFAPRDHFTDGEIEQLLFSNDLAAAEAMAHLDHCSACRARLLLGGNTYPIEAIAMTSQSIRTSDCPSESSVVDLAAGLSSGREALSILQHVVRCSSCSERLRSYLDSFSDTGLPEIQHLQSSQPTWQRGLARTIALTQEPSEGSRRDLWPRQKLVTWMGWSVAALAIFAGLLLWNNRRDSVPRANRLIAAAYSERRPTEFRLGGATYGPVQINRGNAIWHNGEMAEARAILERLRPSSASDPAFWDAEGRADLMDLHIQEAVSDLERAHALKPDSEEATVDLAIAYCMRADGGLPEDYQKALGLLTKVLDSTPNTTIALYNRAIVYERLREYNHALNDWQRFIQNEGTGRWADEARERVREIEKKLEGERQNAISGVLLLPQLDNQRERTFVELQTEKVFDSSLFEWIAHGLDGAEDNQESSLKALNGWATLLDDYHHDLWLYNLLNGYRRKSFAGAVFQLRMAAEDNASGAHDSAISHALAGKAAFAAINNEAGNLRADLEYIYALHRSGHAERCVSQALHARPRARERHYRWLEIQLILEQGICQSMMGDNQASSQLLLEAEALTQAYRYDVLFLRARGVRAAFNSNNGQLHIAWMMDLDGLDHYWSGSYPPIRAYQFYSDMTALAEKAHNWIAARAAGEEAVLSASRSANRYAEAVAELRLAEAIKNCGDILGAATHFERSAHLFDQLPAAPTTRFYKVDAEIRLASLEASTRGVASSLDHLVALEPEVETLQNHVVRIRYFNTVGLAWLNQNNWPNAEKSFRRSLAVTESDVSRTSGRAERASMLRESAIAHRSLVRTLLMQGRDSGALEAWERYRRDDRQTLGELKRSAISLGSDEGLVTEHLQGLRSETFISYMRLDDGLRIWTFNDRGIHGVQVTLSKATLDHTISTFIALCSRPGSDLAQLNALARQIYDWYIAPVEKDLERNRRLVILPDEADWNLPFAALMTSSGTYLIEAFDIAQCTGFSQWLRLRHSAYLSSKDRAVVAVDPRVSLATAEQYPPLPDAASEGKVVAHMFRHATILVGQNVTKRKIGAALDGAIVFHFGGHSIWDGARLGLIVASAEPASNDPDIVEPSHLGEHALHRIRLVFLAACSTARESHEGEVGAEGIARSFLRLGVPNVIASRWDVDSVSTKKLVIDFYQRLLQRKSVSAALCGAARQALGDPATAHPFYWAAFASFGRE